uniref:Ribonuclease 3 n=1 Tax=Ascaris suum TaxID=6253 RepID=F1KS13_ASCSU|nr:DROSHA [Ascaris suum]
MLPSGLLGTPTPGPSGITTPHPTLPSVYVTNPVAFSYQASLGLLNTTAFIQSPLIPFVLPQPQPQLNTLNNARQAFGDHEQNRKCLEVGGVPRANGPRLSLIDKGRKEFWRKDNRRQNNHPKWSMDLRQRQNKRRERNQQRFGKREMPIQRDIPSSNVNATNAVKKEQMDSTKAEQYPAESPKSGTLVDVSDGELIASESEGDDRRDHSKSVRKRWKKETKKRRHRSSTSDSDSDQGDVSRETVPRWQKLTADDFADTPLSDTDEEVDVGELTVANSENWSQTLAAGRYYARNSKGEQYATKELLRLQKRFAEEIIDGIAKQKAEQPKLDPPDIPTFHDNCKCGHQSDTDSEDEDTKESEGEDEGELSDSSSEGENVNFAGMSESKKHNTVARKEANRKRNHPAILHPDLCFNEVAQMNDGPECRCSWAAKRSGVRHNKFAGETVIELCDPSLSNLHRLHHYFLSVEPNPKATARRCTSITFDGKLYELEGFSVFFHRPLPTVFPQNPISRWTSEYNIKFVSENPPENFTIQDLELFHKYLFDHIMEMYDLKRRAFEVTEGCPFYHCLPRFTRSLPENGKELLPMSAVLLYLLESYKPVTTPQEASFIRDDSLAFREFAEKTRGTLVINADRRPSTIRADLIDRPDFLPDNPDPLYPLITHFGLRPSSHTYNSNPEYQKVSKEYMRMRKMMALKVRVTAEERTKLAQKAAELRALRSDSQLKRDFVISISSRGFYQTGLYPDIVHHAMLLILACSHVRFHWSLQVYEEERIHYIFKNRSLLELALTHPSYRTNYGTNPDHARNTLNNCGVRSAKQRAQDKMVQQQLSAKKRGFHTLMEIMSKLGSKKVEQSPLNHNERLEFLGDAVIEFITTIHLFFMFTELDEGGLATYRSTMVQNKNLAVLAKKIGLDEFMLYAHGPDLCHESDLRHAMANAFEAMMAAIYLDAGIDECDRIFGNAMFGGNEELLGAWFELEEHPLKRDNPYGDRHLIKEVPALQLLTEFEKSIGVTFKHIRVLAKAFTRRNVGFNNLTLGHNQRLEFLGDTVLQLITTDYLYKHFPMHHEGHLSILRTCLVSNKTQSVICDDVGMTKYLVMPKAMQKNGAPVLRVKDKADLVESFLGALYVDRGLGYCKVFCRVCFFPRLKFFIVSQRWNDPKSQLQQCCLTLRQVDGGEPDIPEYRTIAVEGPTNTRVYKVAVYFRKKRLAVGSGHTMQIAQMHAAENALIEQAHLFPALRPPAKRWNDDQKRSRRVCDNKKSSNLPPAKRFCTHGADSTSTNTTTLQSTDAKPIKSLLDLKFDSEGRLV